MKYHSAETRQEAARLRQEGMKITEVAERLGIPSGTLRGWFHHDGVHPPPSARRAQSTLTDRIESVMRGQGPMTRAEIRARAGVQKGSFDQAFARLAQDGKIERVERRGRRLGDLWRWRDTSIIDQFLRRPGTRAA